jgi:hypothetical protein
MIETFEQVVGRLVGPVAEGYVLPVLDPEPLLASDDGIAALGAAFLVALCGREHPARDRALAILEGRIDGPHGEVARFLGQAVDLICDEVRTAVATDEALAERLSSTLANLADPRLGASATAEVLWSLFFPEGVGILGSEAEGEAALRARRTVRIREPNRHAVTDPAREILFTSNVLLTVPSSSRPVESLPYPPELARDLAAAAAEPQRHWFDHPIQVGVEPAGNELLHGLRGLDEAIDFEDARRPDGHGIVIVPCVLSVTVTHDGLRRAARPYVEAELGRAGGLRHLDVHAFTESDTDLLVEEVLAPAADPAGTEDAADLLRAVFGVDGEYGRHYSFLKAIAAFWHVVVDPRVRGTFKIDLDQVFPQAELVAETGRSAFEHLANPTWGAGGVDAAGRLVELGMIAGALVNERDIGRGLFTPDVPYPTGHPAADELVFFSRLPQALSSAAEMMERHDSIERDGAAACLERLHVTGGTNGVLVEALRRHRPFTPAFIGRAEDQAYVLSVLGRPGPRLAYGHAAGLLMRHDKEAFAGEAIAAAHVGKLVGDYVRILEFSACADAVAGDGTNGSLDLAGIKQLLDPFTGCFVSRLPVTVTMLRFALRLARFFAEGEAAAGHEFALVGARRIGDALRRTRDRAALRDAIDRERRGWDLYYDALDTLEEGISASEPRALALARRGREIVAACRVAGEAPVPRAG